MSDHRRSHAPVDGEAGRLARLLVLALGLLGLVMLPGAGPSSAGSGIGARAGAAQQPSAHQAGRGRAATAPNLSVAGQAVETAYASAAPPPHAAPLAELALPARDVRPAAPVPSGVAAAGHDSCAADGVWTSPPRGRAPPVSTGF